LSKLTKEQVIAGIEGHRPWYQRIDFPEYDVATTDRDEWTFFDRAGDNMYGDMDSRMASKMRPQPKWLRIQEFVKPYIVGHSVLEVGCAHGFYSLAFAQMGAERVLGIDQSAWVKNAQFAKGVLGATNVEFRELDIFNAVHPNCPHLNDRSGPKERTIPRVDTVFVSSALTHFLYPMAGLHKMAAMADKYFILDDGYAGLGDGHHMPTTTFYWEGGTYGNVWGTSLRLIVKFLWRVGYSPSAMTFLFYPRPGEEKGPKRMCLVLDKTKDQSYVSEEDRQLWGGRDHPGRFEPPAHKA
jgi:SAM-dependent methyltransferase